LSSTWARPQSELRYSVTAWSGKSRGRWRGRSRCAGRGREALDVGGPQAAEVVAGERRGSRFQLSPAGAAAGGERLQVHGTAGRGRTVTGLGVGRVARRDLQVEPLQEELWRPHPLRAHRGELHPVQQRTASLPAKIGALVGSNPEAGRGTCRTADSSCSPRWKRPSMAGRVTAAQIHGAGAVAVRSVIGVRSRTTTVPATRSPRRRDWGWKNSRMAPTPKISTMLGRARRKYSPMLAVPRRPGSPGCPWRTCPASCLRSRLRDREVEDGDDHPGGEQQGAEEAEDHDRVGLAAVAGGRRRESR